jgi:hypothetical protein
VERHRRIIPKVHLLLALAALVACPVGANGQGSDVGADTAREMWIELSEPVASADLAPEARAARVASIEAEQARLVAQLRELGIKPVTRVLHVRNAVLVIMSPQQAEAVSRLPGVRRIVPADERRSPEVHGTDPARG